MSHINPSLKSQFREEELKLKPASYYIDGIVKDQDYYVLAESITLLESKHESHQKTALKVLSSCYENRPQSFRCGITGSPGVGKSTFIDSIAGTFTTQGYKVGILTIDPTSVDGKGSILGDKTRMEEIIKDESIFIRPSPSNLHLGGLNRYTFEAIILCEAAGIDRIFVETVGVGQSEIEVSNNTDATILLVTPGGGDGLQGIKKGVLERADMIVIHKSDGERVNLANISKKEYEQAIHLSSTSREVPITNYSSITETGKAELLKMMDKLIKSNLPNLSTNRAQQERRWIDQAIFSNLDNRLNEEMSEIGIDEIINQKIENTSPFKTYSYLADHLEIKVRLSK